MNSTDKRQSIGEKSSEIPKKRSKMTAKPANKTSIMVLQELCAKKNPKNLPVYTELTEEPEEYAESGYKFFIRCQALGFMSVGGGDTKKIAKHTSAQKLINKFFQPTGWDAEEDDDRSLHSNGQNSVSNLMDLCVQKGYHKPTFKELTSYGPSHAPTFEIECQLNSVKQSAEAGNKQQAKAMAAQKVLDILLSGYPDIEKKVVLPNTSNQTKETSRQKVTTYLDLKKKDLVGTMGTTIRDRNKFFLNQEDDFVTCVKDLLKSQELSDEEKYEKLLQEIETMWAYKIDTVEGSDLMKFELLVEFEKFSCVILGTKEGLPMNVLDYFKTMFEVCDLEPCGGIIYSQDIDIEFI